MEQQDFDFNTTANTKAAVNATTTVDENGVVISDTYTKEVPIEDVGRLIGVIKGVIGDRVAGAMDGSGKAAITLTDVTDEELDLIERKVNISNWSSATISVAGKITNFATDVADYALNGALAPSAVAVAGAAITTGRIVGTAAVKTGAGILTSGLVNGHKAVREIKNSAEIKDCKKALSDIWSDVSNTLFGKSGSTSWKRKTA